MTKQAIGYTRVSTGQQVKDGLSLEAQKEKIRAWCDYNNYDLVGIFTDEGISGASMKNRTELNHALKVVKKGMVFVTYSLSRLTRSIRDLLKISDDLQKKDVDLVSLSEKLDTTTAAGKLMFRMLGVIGEFEKDVTSERTKMVKRSKKEKGEYNGGIIPLGFRLSSDGKMLVEVVKEQESILLAKELRNKGYTVMQIKEALTLRNYLNRVGKPFHHHQISRILGEAKT